jgi:hypothetical protein
VPANPPTSDWKGGYDIGIDPASDSSKSRILTVRSTAAQVAVTPSVGAAWQPAYGYAGQRLRFSGQVRTEGAPGWAGLYMGVGEDGVLWRLASGEAGAEQHLPMGARVAAGTAGWQDVSVVIDVPADAPAIHLGLALVGEGQVWARELRFETVGADVPLSSTPIGIDWAKAREFRAQTRRTLAQVPPQPLANTALD